LWKDKGESVNRSHMDMKLKTFDIRTWKKHLFLDISSIKIDTLVPSLYLCVQTRSTEVFWLLSQPLLHLRFNLVVMSKTFATQLWNAWRDKHFPPWTGNIPLWIRVYRRESEFSSGMWKRLKLCQHLKHYDNYIVVCTGDYRRGFGLVMHHLHTSLWATNNYSVAANLHNSQITTAHGKTFPACCFFTSRSLEKAF
jgi:hypothetical protein